MKRISTPITYYGGKQKLLRYILPLIPEHTLYAEPFTGGGAVFFAKEPSEIEVLNDTNRRLITFYQTAKTGFRKLQRSIRGTLHSRSSHRKARLIYGNPEFFSGPDIAWAVWVLAAQSFASRLDGPFGYDKTKQVTTKKVMAKRDSLTAGIMHRLENAQIECADACYVITSRDTAQSFFYCDPPYFNSDMGHYKGYTEADFAKLLALLAGIKGKFLLSSYPSGLLKKYTKANGWHRVCIRQACSVYQKGDGRKAKEEVLTANYPIGIDGQKTFIKTK